MMKIMKMMRIDPAMKAMQKFKNFLRKKDQKRKKRNLFLLKSEWTIESESSTSLKWFTWRMAWMKCTKWINFHHGILQTKITCGSMMEVNLPKSKLKNWFQSRLLYERKHLTSLRFVQLRYWVQWIMGERKKDMKWILIMTLQMHLFLIAKFKINLSNRLLENPLQTSEKTLSFVHLKKYINLICLTLKKWLSKSLLKFTAHKKNDRALIFIQRSHFESWI